MAVVGAETALLVLPNVLLRRKQPENGKKEISPVLEPNFDLPLGEAEMAGHLDPPSPREVVVRVELLFQLECLVPAKQACHVLRTNVACQGNFSCAPVFVHCARCLLAS